MFILQWWQLPKKKVLFYEIVLNYKLNDDFTAGDKDKNEAFMAQFKSAIAFLDTDLNGKVNLDEKKGVINYVN